MRTLRASALTFPVLATLMSAQIVVSGGGAALQQAILAAPPGSHLVVQPGAYSAVAATRGMHIQLIGPVSIANAVNTPAVTVLGLPLGETFLLEGLGGTISQVRIANCAGDVTFANLDLIYTSQATSTIDACSGAVMFQSVGPSGMAPMTGGSIQISSSAQVSFDTVSLRQNVGVTNSRVSLVDVTIATTSLGGGFWLDGGGAVIDGGSVSGSPFHFGPLPGVNVVAGELTVTGGAVISAGPATPWPGNVPAINMVGGSARIDPSVVLNASVVGIPTIGGQAAAAAQTLRIPSLGVTHTPAAMTVNVFAEPGAAVFTLAGLPMPAVPTPWGDAWLSPAEPILDATVMPPSGAHLFTQTFANVPPFVVLTVQSVALTPAGALVLGAPTRFAWD